MALASDRSLFRISALIFSNMAPRSRSLGMSSQRSSFQVVIGREISSDNVLPVELAASSRRVAHWIWVRDDGEDDQTFRDHKILARRGARRTEASSPIWRRPEQASERQRVQHPGE